jgi:hypothetical protein
MVEGYFAGRLSFRSVGVYERMADSTAPRTGPSGLIGGKWKFRLALFSR